MGRIIGDGRFGSVETTVLWKTRKQ
jgi:hypothetical protein